MALNPVLCLSAVDFAYPATPVLQDVSLEIAASEGVALLGPNGAGKTTLTRLAMAMLQPLRGTVETVGRPTAERAPEDLADRVGYLFQNPEAQLVERTVQAEVSFGPRHLGWPAARIDSATREVLAELDLTSAASTHPYDLPAARRRLVALASALVVDPAFLILDEPTAGLDRVARQTVCRVVRERLARGCAVLAVSHDVDFAIEVLDRALILQDRRIVRDGEIAQVLVDSVELGLPLPAPALLAQRIPLASVSWRAEDVARALAERCRSSGPPVS
ncbi:MAG: ABC transporter ATP-binding protein [Gemmatimonadales bacterium]|nr:ABC transporter ATP-binding protein [Gemmatimonadales bacterium]